jgi:hypothetical protein
MTGPDASSGEMGRLSVPGRAGRDHDEVLLDMILDRRPLPPDAPPGMHTLAGGLAGLAAAPGEGQLPGQAAALAAFARSGSPASTLPLPGVPSQPRQGRWLTAGRARLSAAAAVIVVAVSGTAAAAYAGVLPASVQNFAHRVIDAPAAHHQVPDGRGGQGQQGRSPGTARPSPHAGRPAKPGKQKGHKGRGHRSEHGQPAKKPKPSHPAHPSHPAPTAHPGHSQDPSDR